MMNMMFQTMQNIQNNPMMINRMSQTMQNIANMQHMQQMTPEQQAAFQEQINQVGKMSLGHQARIQTQLENNKGEEPERIECKQQ